MMAAPQAPEEAGGGVRPEEEPGRAAADGAAADDAAPPPAAAATTSLPQTEQRKEDDDDNDEDPKQQPPPPVCDHCHAQPSKYRCPGCGARTCSAACVAAHKSERGCTGKRDRQAFVPLASFTDAALLSDLKWLEEVQRAGDNARRHRPPMPRRELPPPLAGLAHQARLRGCRLLLQPPGMARRRGNTTRYDFRNRAIQWRVEWRFVVPILGPTTATAVAAADEGGQQQQQQQPRFDVVATVYDDRFDEREPLWRALAAHLTYDPTRGGGAGAGAGAGGGGAQAVALRAFAEAWREASPLVLREGEEASGGAAAAPPPEQQAQEAKEERQEEEDQQEEEQEAALPPPPPPPPPPPQEQGDPESATAPARNGPAPSHRAGLGRLAVFLRKEAGAIASDARWHPVDLSKGLREALSGGRAVVEFPTLWVALRSGGKADGDDDKKEDSAIAAAFPRAQADGGAPEEAAAAAVAAAAAAGGAGRSAGAWARPAPAHLLMQQHQQYQPHPSFQGSGERGGRGGRGRGRGAGPGGGRGGGGCGGGRGGRGGRGGGSSWRPRDDDGQQQGPGSLPAKRARADGGGGYDGGHDPAAPAPGAAAPDAAAPDAAAPDAAAPDAVAHGAAFPPPPPWAPRYYYGEFGAGGDDGGELLAGLEDD